MSVSSGNNDDTPPSNDNNNVSEKAKDKTGEKKITYKKVSANQLLKDLDKNALNAEKEYEDQYVSITGKLSNIDSSGDYISIENTDNEFYMYNIQCFVQDDKQLDKISKFSKGDKITVKGKITDVGEIMGYTLDIDDISK